MFFIRSLIGITRWYVLGIFRIARNSWLCACHVVQYSFNMLCARVRVVTCTPGERLAYWINDWASCLLVLLKSAASHCFRLLPAACRCFPSSLAALGPQREGVWQDFMDTSTMRRVPWNHWRLVVGQLFLAVTHTNDRDRHHGCTHDRMYGRLKGPCLPVDTPI